MGMRNLETEEGGQAQKPQLKASVERRTTKATKKTRERTYTDFLIGGKDP